MFFFLLAPSHFFLLKSETKLQGRESKARAHSRHHRHHGADSSSSSSRSSLSIAAALCARWASDDGCVVVGGGVAAAPIGRSVSLRSCAAAAVFDSHFVKREPFPISAARGREQETVPARARERQQKSKAENTFSAAARRALAPSSPIFPRLLVPTLAAWRTPTAAPLSRARRCERRRSKRCLKSSRKYSFSSSQ